MAGDPSTSLRVNGRREEEKDNAETLRTQRLPRGGRTQAQNEVSERGRVPKREAELGWRPVFTVYATAFMITFQYIPYIVTIRMACAWGVS
jgi:hypothetical protein